MIGTHKRGSKEGLRWITSLALLFLATTAFGQVGQQLPYYGSDFYEKLSSRSNYADLRDDLYHILSSRHQKVDGDFDRIGQCNGRDCYSHKDLGYEGGRKYLFGKLHLKQDGDVYWLRGVYCGEIYSSDNFPSGSGPGPMRIPNHNVVNAEHTWPQSRFNSRESKSMQKSDLHNLYPTKNKANSDRGNFEFGEVDDVEHTSCPGAYRGYVQGAGSQLFFEPPDDHKGNVARSLFYFATRYDLKISETQERFIRQWHKLDPVDAEEAARNEAIYEIQMTRNPFIDHPEIADFIGDF